MNILVVCKLANSTLKDNVLLPMLSSPVVDNIYVLRDFAGDYKDSRVHYIVPESPQKGYFRHIGRFFKGRKALKQYGIGAIVGVLNKPHGYIGRFMSIFYGVPYVHMTIAGHREFWMNGHLMEYVNLKLLTSGKAITVTGSKTRDYLLKKNVAEDKIFILPNLPDSRFFSAEPLGVYSYDIVSFSRIDKNKNLILLVKALSELKKRHKFKVAVAGDGDQLDNIKEAVSEFGLNEEVVFLGYISDVKEKIDLLTRSKIFVSCSRGEGFPISLLEAMDCGCVPVVSDVGDITDVVESGKNGIVFTDTENECELVGAFDRLLSDEALLKKMRDSSSECKRKFSLEANGRIWTSVFKKVVE